MKIHKRLVALLLALCLMCGCVVAYAAETTITNASENKTATTKVSLNLGGETSYTITIPASVDLNTDTTRFRITLESNFKLVDTPSLKVRLTGGYENGTTSSKSQPYMVLKNSANGTTFNYPFFVSDYRNATYLYDIEGIDLIKAVATEPDPYDRSATIHFGYAGSANTLTLPEYGNYSGTLTFSVITGEE